MSVWVTQFKGLFGDSRHRGPYSPYKPFLIVRIWEKIDHIITAPHCNNMWYGFTVLAKTWIIIVWSSATYHKHFSMKFDSKCWKFFIQRNGSNIVIDEMAIFLFSLNVLNPRIFRISGPRSAGCLSNWYWCTRRKHHTGQCPCAAGPFACLPCALYVEHSGRFGCLWNRAIWWCCLLRGHRTC